MSILEELHKPDILDCISHLSSDEVFTPPKVVNGVLDMLPQELFQDPDTKFLDPCCKTGVFLREIAKRLIEGLKDKIPNLEERLEHIFKEQLFGLAITELTALLSRRSVYCSKVANGEFSIVQFPNEDGNIEYDKNIEHIWLNGKCTMCKATQSEWDRDRKLESHAYSFIHTDELRRSKLFKRLKDMKFDVIIGNPPYQLNDGGNAASASPLYHLFVNQAKKLNPRYITMIIPARWYAGGKGLDNFRDEMLKDDRIRILDDFPSSSDCFKGPMIEGGICYFLWDRDNRGKCLVKTHKGDTVVSEMERDLLEENAETFIRQNEAISILKKVQALKECTMDSQVSSRKPFGLATNFTDFEDNKFENGIKIYANGKTGWVKKAHITRGLELTRNYNVYISKAYGYGSNPTFPHQIINKPFVGDINSCCTETYIILGSYPDLKQAENLEKYVKTLFFRFLVYLRKNTQDAPRQVYSFVPIQDFREEWTDEKLYKKYRLTEEEIAFIEATVKPIV